MYCLGFAKCFSSTCAPFGKIWVCHVQYLKFCGAAAWLVSRSSSFAASSAQMLFCVYLSVVEIQLSVKRRLFRWLERKTATCLSSHPHIRVVVIR